jgi:hypothetical protein
MATNTTNSQSLTAEMVKEKIKNAKGYFVKAAWKSNPKPAASFKEMILEKRTVAVVQAGVNFANLSTVKDGIEKGERGEVGELPWGSWKEFPYIIEHKGAEYIRLYPSHGHNHTPKSMYYVNGQEVDKATFASYLTKSEAEKILNPKEEDRPLCFTVKSDNIMGIPEDVVE